MVAPGTLDHTIQKVQRANSEVLDAIVGGTGHQVAVPEDQIDSRAAGETMWELAAPLLRRCEKAAAGRRRGAAWRSGGGSVPAPAGGAHRPGRRPARREGT